jgi:hypothetical protein
MPANMSCLHTYIVDACPVLCLPKNDRTFLLLIWFNQNIWSVSLSFLPCVLILEKERCQKHANTSAKVSPVLKQDLSLKSKCQEGSKDSLQKQSNLQVVCIYFILFETLLQGLPLNHYYRAGHLQRFDTAISYNFRTIANVPLLISIISSGSRTAANNRYNQWFLF